ncbi:MAG: LacI family DNA-binding transcriptional regulator [Phycisphaerae bacterium]|nr:LacI family DNA-binding transcriptional regulator [Phycisphaerae bacterium]
MTTIRDVADQAGVSVATVSYVMNDRLVVGDETRQRVLRVARNMNYVPRRSSRKTSREKRNVKSLAFVSCLPFDPWGEAYWGQFLTGCVDASHETDSMLQVARVDPETPSEASDIPVVVRHRLVDGIIVAGWPSRSVVDSLADLSLPMVLLDTRDVYEGFTHIRPDHGGGMTKLVRYLHELGHRRIGVINWKMGFACEGERNSAFHMAMSELGLPMDKKRIITREAPNEDAGREGMKEFLRRQCDATALICHGDHVARGAMFVAQEAGVKIPRDLSIVGVDNQPWSARSDPPLTTVDVSLVELGRVAVENLLRMIANPKASPRRVTIEAKIVVRASAASVKA